MIERERERERREKERGPINNESPIERFFFGLTYYLKL